MLVCLSRAWGGRQLNQHDISIVEVCGAARIKLLGSHLYVKQQLHLDTTSPFL